MNELFKNDITLDQENHKYILDSSPEFKFSSVTEFIHFFFEKFDQEKVATKLINTNPKYSGKTLNEVLKEWGKGAERGTIVHNELEMYVKENIDSVPTYELLSPLLALCFGIPVSKKFKQEVNDLIRARDIKRLEDTYINLIAA